MKHAVRRCAGICLSALAAIVTLAGSAVSRVHAEESQFGYVYTTDLLPQGAKEVEQWATWRHQKVAGYFDQVDGRTEFEYGMTDKLQLAFYANYVWSRAYHNGPFEETTPPEPLSYDRPGPDDHYSAKRFVGFSGEAIYRIWSPYTDPLGVAVYVEPTVGPQFRELETKLILQKNFFDDRLVTAFNFTYAPELRYDWSDDAMTHKRWQEETDVNLNVAASYRFAPNWSAGVELLNEREYASYNFSNEANDGYYVGPVIHYGGKKFFVTATFLEQLPWASSHSDTVPGAIVGRRIYDNDFEKYRVRIKAGWYF
ncbi:hypothetical protein SAMN04487785_11757 [Dyella jiangningensis]|uniref:DUF6662 family protein n=1 Tax=Dyella sp. AtDHG13 TaxID=1938897 RepID=UPI00087E1B01|nr:DUF6662 family protein [Dyella sp. AtDHG13]PXV59025.1 hypothetical protein BDW41_10469 [Dyella sp. AtDHG13]SDL29133.1 hypothetical protein SAMN04487785_11757 [Dyella jiangningensis]